MVIEKETKSKDRTAMLQVSVSEAEKTKVRANAALFCVETGIRPNTAQAIRFLLTDIDPVKLAKAVKSIKEGK